MSSDPSRLIAALARDRINLDLKTLDLCFLAGLYLRADRASLASFEEDVLIDMFMQICDVVDRGAERPRKRVSLIGERGFDGFGEVLGVFSAMLISYPHSYPHFDAPGITLAGEQGSVPTRDYD